MRSFFLIPFAAQGVAIAVDEFYFHRRRGLGRWERVGHPVDTAAFLTCLLMVAFAPSTTIFHFAYAACGVFSCLLITKDEWVHARECSGKEHWLHSFLFMLHPTSLISAAWFWPELARPGLPVEKIIYLGFVAGVSGFLLYQIFYWNILNAKNRAI